MAIFNSYVKLPEGKMTKTNHPTGGFKNKLEQPRHPRHPEAAHVHRARGGDTKAMGGQLLALAGGGPGA